MEKSCIICGKVKPLSEYYKHPAMGDGHLNKCKKCTKDQSKKRHHVLKNDPDWMESERKRGRKKYHKYKYKSKVDYNNTLRHREKYPEKYKAKSRTSSIKKELDHLHHWSYNDQHHKDIIHMTIKDHAKAHRFLIYDQERMMYRRSDNNQLLDTKEKHLKYINHCIEHEED